MNDMKKFSIAGAAVALMVLAPLVVSTATRAASSDSSIRLAMDGMQMQPSGQNQSGGGMSMMDDNMNRMGGQTAPPSGGGMQMPQQPSQGGQSGMQAPSGAPGSNMNDGMMRMMDGMMRMMNDSMRMRSGGGGMGPGMAPASGPIDVTDRIEGRLAFLRAELRITDAQSVAWNAFAEALRASRRHLLEARQVLEQPMAAPVDRLELHERHLNARLEALRAARIAFGQLNAILDDAQKRTANELVVPFIATF